MFFKKIFILFTIFTCISTNANAFLFYKKNKNVDEKEIHFYNEKNDTNEKNIVRKNKNYSKIGFEEYSQKNIWQKKYVGVDVNFWLKRLGDDIKEQIFYQNLWKRMQNLDIYAGKRFFKYLGIEIGYTHLGNFIAKNGEKHGLDGMYSTIMLYSPVVDLKYTSIEGYVSAGSAILFGSMNNGKPEFGGKFGGGFIFHLYSTVALNVGLDYYLPFKSYTNKGFLAIKTGINFYLNI